MANSLEELLRMAVEKEDASDLASTFPAARERFGLSLPPQFITPKEEAIEDLGVGGLGDMLIGGGVGLRVAKKLGAKGVKEIGKKVAEWGAPIVDVGGIPLPVDPGFYKATLGKPAGWAARKTGLSKLGTALMKPFEDAPSVAGKITERPIQNIQGKGTDYRTIEDWENRFPATVPALEKERMIRTMPKSEQKDFGISRSFEQVHQMMDKSPMERAGFHTKIGGSTMDKMKRAKEKSVEEAFRAGQAREAQRDSMGWRLPVAEKYTTMGMKKAAESLAALKAAPPVEAAPVKAVKKTRKKENKPNEKARQMQEKIDMVMKQE